MIVAFLDLLGFSYLLEEDQEVALANLNYFNNTLLIKKIDEKHYEKAKSVSSFSYLISFSDSLVLGSDQPTLFIKQLSDYLTGLYVDSTRPFINGMDPLNNIILKKEGFHTGDERVRAFPVLFRGGLALGNDVSFFEEYHICEEIMERTSLNVTGVTYLDAVKLEKTGSGPRLFCSKKVADEISDKTIIREVDSERNIYEIIWTVRACEKLECSPENLIYNSVYKTLLIPALNLYRYYRNYYYHLENNEGEKIIKQYEELVRLVCRGSLIYARKKSDQEYREVFNALSKILAGYPELKNILEI